MNKRYDLDGQALFFKGDTPRLAPPPHVPAPKWVNSPRPKSPRSTDAGKTLNGVTVTHFAAARFGRSTRFRMLYTLRRNLVCWQREVFV